MPNHDEVAARWVDVLCGDTYPSNGRPVENFSAYRQNIFGRGNVLYSYGTHFPLAEYYRADRRRRRPLFLLNGDRFSVTTSRHQSAARAAVDRGARRLGADTILLPFSALDSARIDRASIRPLEVRDDTWLELEESAARLEDVPEWARFELVRHSAARIEDVPDEVCNRGWSDRYSHEGNYRDRRDESARFHWTERVYLEPDETGRYSWTRRVHRLGDSLFTAETSETVRRRREWTVLDVVRTAGEYVSAERYESRRGRSADMNPLASAGRRLESLELEPIVESETVRRRRRYVSSFDVNEPVPAYFLATLPAASRALSVDTAIMDLAPAAVHAAILRGRDVRRQGDIFLIGTDLADVDVIAGARSRARLTQWTRNAAAKVGEAGYLEPVSDGRWRRIRKEARRLYLERMTSGEHMARPGPSSSRGIRRKARRDRELFEGSLATYRELARRAILRGDMDRLEYARRHLSGMLERGHDGLRAAERDKYRHVSIADRGVARDRMSDSFVAAYRRHSGRPESTRELIRGALTVHGTAHTATEVVKRPDGRTYVRGIVRHVPELAGEFRARDHVNVRLERDTWYLAVRNTVPRSRDTAGR